MLHALVKNLDRRSHRADHAAADDSLRQLEVMEAEYVHPFVEIQQPLRHIVQSEKFSVPTVNVIHAQVSLSQLGVKRFSQARANVKQREKAGRIQTAAM